MRPIYNLIIFLVAGIWTTGCGNTEDFVINGSIAGVDAQTVSVIYFNRSGMQSQSAQATGGKFSLRGVAATPTLAVLSLGDGTRLATLIVRNGEEINLEVDPSDPYNIKLTGSTGSQEIASWLNENARALAASDAAAINAAVAQYIESHPSRISATAILVNYYSCPGYESAADSLFSMLKQQARPADIVQGFNAVVNAQLTADSQAPVTYMSMYELRDSMITYSPSRSSASLLCFTTDNRSSLDSIRGHLRRLRTGHSEKALQLLEISTAPDSATWRGSFRGDTIVSWKRTWLPGSLGAPSVRKLAIPRLPFFIVTDSTGAQIYRGASLKGAEAALTPLLSR